MESIALDLVERGRTLGDGKAEEEEEVGSNEMQEKATICDNTTNIKPAPFTKGLSLQELTNSRRETESRKTSTSSLRTCGAASNSGLPIPGLHILYRRPETVVTRSLAPVIPKGELVLMKPRLITKSPRSSSLPDHQKTKLPKFVPFEPYPGAVNPIIPTNSTQRGNHIPRNAATRPNKNNLDIAILATQMSTMRVQELQSIPGQQGELDEKITMQDVRSRNELLEEIEQLKKERDYFHGQFKFQTQVNAELKNLLVASVGEDLQTRVNVLTEDKLQLARALLDTANNLTTHTEQIEFLAGQCEVWRSKFLASSVMVEELARWKADLTQKNQMLNESTKRLLHSTHQLREMQLDMLKSLKFLAKIRYLNLPATDVISLSAENLNILQQLVLHSGVGMPETNLNISSTSANPLCDAEKYAVQALEFISQPLMATDDAIRALFDQAQRPYGIQLNSTIITDQPDSMKKEET